MSSKKLSRNTQRSIGISQVRKTRNKMLLTIPRRRIFMFTFSFLCFSILLAAQGLVVNEVMSNVKGTDSGVGSPGDRNEFIELFNSSPDTLDLSEYTISDGDAVDEINAWTDTLITDPDVVYGTTSLPPSYYAVILDPEYTDIGDGSYIQPYDFPPQTIVVMVGNTTIGDGLSTTDPIMLFSSSGDTVSTYGSPLNQNDSIPFDPGDGISAERLSPYLPDDERYWIVCNDTTGATPGRSNSCLSQGGLCIPASGFSIAPEHVEPFQVVTLSALIQNQSPDTAFGVHVDFFNDSNWDSVCTGNELIESVIKESTIPPFGCSLRVEVDWKPEKEGNQRVGVKLHNNEKATVFRMAKIGNPIGEIVVNEVMYAPEQGGEWLELYNRSLYPVDITDWNIRVGQNDIMFITSHTTIILPGDFLLLVENKSQFFTRWGNVSCNIIELPSWSSMNNSTDTISVEDSFNFLFDEMYYDNGSEQGVSLERINPHIEGISPWNWGESCDYSGGTPGKKNSIFAVSTASNTILSVTPNPFSPDGDGYDERTVVAYELPFTRAKVNLLLYTRTGVQKYCFFSQQDSGKYGSVIWDGKDSKGKKMPVGLYIIYLEAVDKDSNQRVVQKTAVVIAGRR
jgi:hypothetical protein